MTLPHTFAAALSAVLLAGPAAFAMDAAAQKKMLETIDDRQRNGGDYK